MFNLVAETVLKYDLGSADETSILITLNSADINIDKYYNSSIGAISTKLLNGVITPVADGAIAIFNTLFGNGIDVNMLLKGILGSDFLQFETFTLTNLEHLVQA